MAEDLADERIAVEARVPGHSDTRAELAVERVVRILQPVRRIAQQGKPDFRVVYLALQRGALALVQVSLGANRLVGLIYQLRPVFRASIGGISSAQPKP